jgi:hypothetical protein
VISHPQVALEAAIETVVLVLSAPGEYADHARQASEVVRTLQCPTDTIPHYCRCCPAAGSAKRRQHMLSALADLFATSPEEAKDEAGATISAVQQIAILLVKTVASP